MPVVALYKRLYNIPLNFLYTHRSVSEKRVISLEISEASIIYSGFIEPKKVLCDASYSGICAGLRNHEGDPHGR